MEMSKVQVLRALVKQRLSAAAEEIFGLFERTISEYEQELCRSKEENQRHRKLLDAVFQPEVRLHRAVSPADVQQLLQSRQEVAPMQPELSPSLDQEDPPEPPHIEEEQEELWTSQEGEQLPGLEEADITKFPFTPVSVKSEEDEEKPQSSQLHQSQTEQMEADGEYCGGPEPESDSGPDRLLQPETEDKTKDSSEPETGDSDGGWEETREPYSDLKSLSDTTCHTSRKLLSCSECVETFYNNRLLNIHSNHTGELKGEKQEDPALPSDVRKVIVGEQQEWSPNLDQEDPPGPPYIKEEPEELCSSQEGEQLPGLEEADITKFPFTPVPVKSEEDDEEKPQSSQLHQSPTALMETEADGEDCGGPQPARNSDPDRHFQLGDDWEKTREPQSDLNSHNNDVPVSRRTHITDKKQFNCSECGKTFTLKTQWKVHMRRHAGEKPFSCSECGKRFTVKSNLQQHLRTHTGEKPYSCSECGKRFAMKHSWKRHMGTHSGEKPFSCSECGKTFTQKGTMRDHLKNHTEKLFSCSECGKKFTKKGSLQVHMRRHTGEKPFSCSECGKRFSLKVTLQRHMIIHTEEKPFSCSECGKTFAVKGSLKLHMRTHTGEKPFSCSECGKTFTLKTNLKVHMRIHTGEKPFSCSVCDRRFTWCKQLKKHKCGDESSHGNQPENREAEPRASSSAEDMEA
ncbi:zinc finger protein 135-like isoform X2 [Micropterus salmoides]|uniref:zinc finger protein 135-like isoform X2 n=1 Tax=Micropterus salmoides TaxID=27706 RepID=UPI0018EA4EF5|nr:zinc finger protein 135-like isoform X2 [Micropterus salmoides]